MVDILDDSTENIRAGQLVPRNKKSLLSQNGHTARHFFQNVLGFTVFAWSSAVTHGSVSRDQLIDVRRFAARVECQVLQIITS